MKPLAAALALCTLCACLASRGALAQEAPSAPPTPPTPPNDPIAEHVSPPELATKYQKAMQLSGVQTNSPIAEVKRAQGRIGDVQWDVLLAQGTPPAPPAAPAPPAPPAPPAVPNDPIAEQVFPPELIMKYQKAIQLSEAQKNALVAEVKRAQGRIVDVQWDMQRAMEPLVELLGKDKPDEPQVLAQLDKVLAAERDFKRVQLTLAVRLKGILTPEQQRTLQGMRNGAPRANEAPKASPPR